MSSFVLLTVDVLPNRLAPKIAGLKPAGVWPLNQKGTPAASTMPLTGAVPGMNSGAYLPLFGKCTVWNPLGVKATVSPTRMATFVGKNALTSAGGLSAKNPPALFAGGPADTVLVAPCAAPGATSRARPAMQQIAHLFLEIILFSSRIPRPAHPGAAQRSQKRGTTANPCARPHSL